MTVDKLNTALELYREISSKSASIWVYQRTTGQVLFAVFARDADFDLATAPDVQIFARVLYELG